MRIIRGKDLKAVPASHEDKNDPGCLKKVLAKKEDLVPGKIQMINWSTLLPNKNFEPHYHQDMQEIFIILNGKVEIEVKNNKLKIKNKKEETEKAILNAGDSVIIDEKEIHKMTNLTENNISYIAIGVARGVGGKTINVFGI